MDQATMFFYGFMWGGVTVLGIICLALAWAVPNFWPF